MTVKIPLLFIRVMMMIVIVNVCLLLQIFLKQNPLVQRMTPLPNLINLQFPAAKSVISAHCKSKTKRSQSKWPAWLAYQGVDKPSPVKKF